MATSGPVFSFSIVSHCLYWAGVILFRYFCCFSSSTIVSHHRCLLKPPLLALHLCLQNCGMFWSCLRLRQLSCLSLLLRTTTLLPSQRVSIALTWGPSSKAVAKFGMSLYVVKAPLPTAFKFHCALVLTNVNFKPCSICSLDILHWIFEERFLGILLFFLSFLLVWLEVLTRLLLVCLS